MIRPQRSPEIGLPLRYLATGMVAWLVAAVAVPLLAVHLISGFDDPKVFALTHLVVLGWVTMTLMGVLYQLFPVALRASLAAPRLARWNYLVYAGGVAGFVPSFYFNWTPGVAGFGSLAVLGILIFATLLAVSYRTVSARHPMGTFVLCGLAWLLVTIGFGLTWALDWQFRWFAITPSMLAAHVHAGLAGWLGCTLIGVSYKLMELFALAHRRSWRAAHVLLVLWNVSLAALVLGLLLWPASLEVTVAASMLAAAVLLFAADLFQMWRGRRRRRVSVEQGHVAVSLVSLLLAAGLGVILSTRAGVPPRAFVAYGYAAIMGGFGFAIAGRYQKILPFLTWVHRYSRGPGPTPPPLLQDLVDERLGWVSLLLLSFGYVTTLVGLLTASQVSVLAGGSVYAAGALLGLGAVRLTLLPAHATRRSGPLAAHPDPRGRMPAPPTLGGRPEARPGLSSEAFPLRPDGPGTALGRRDDWRRGAVGRGPHRLRAEARRPAGLVCRSGGARLPPVPRPRPYPVRAAGRLPFPATAGPPRGLRAGGRGRGASGRP